MAVDQFTRLMPEQQDCLASLARLWAEYGSLVHEREGGLTGGMNWKTVRGVEYLVRYRPDPEGRSRQSMSSLGRRSRETEEVLGDFLRRRAVVMAEIERMEPRLRVTAKAASAIGLARLDWLTAQSLRRLDRAGLLGPERPILVPLGAPGLAACEMSGGLVLDRPPAATDEEDDALTFYVRQDAGPLDMALARRVARSLFTAKIPVAVEQWSEGCFVLSGVDADGEPARIVDLISREAVERELATTGFGSGASHRLLVERLEHGATASSVVAARDGSSARFAAFDPFTYALASRTLARAGSSPRAEQRLAEARGNAVAGLIRSGRLRVEMNSDMEAALSEVVLNVHRRREPVDTEEARDAPGP